MSVQSSYHALLYSGDQASLHYNNISQGFSLGFARTQPISRTRTLEMSGGGGADLIANKGASRYWQPTYYASLATDIARSWSLSSDYRQTSWVLTSPLSAPDSYLNQTLSLSVGGNLQRDLDLTVFAAATLGEVAAPHSVTGTKEHYTGLNSGAQLSRGLWSGWSVVFAANYYKSELSGAAKQFLLTSGRIQRTSIRLGLSWNAPLFGLDRRARSAGDR
jgi:hypothetical protein